MIEKVLQKLNIAAESRSVILAALAASILFSWLFPKLIFLFVLMLAFVCFFFRDPVREIAPDPLALVAPCDGTITDIDMIGGLDFSCRPLRRIGVFLSVLDVHVQRFPCSGEIGLIEYKKGMFNAAFLKKAGRENESNLIVLKAGEKIMAIKQIAGFIARRIVCNVLPNDKVAKGARFGLIMFGSRVELYLPEDIELLVAVRDKVIAGVTVIGVIK